MCGRAGGGPAVASGPRAALCASRTSWRRVNWSNLQTSSWAIRSDPHANFFCDSGSAVIRPPPSAPRRPVAPCSSAVELPSVASTSCSPVEPIGATNPVAAFAPSPPGEPFISGEPRAEVTIASISACIAAERCWCLP